MAQTEEVVVLKVKTIEAVESVNDLKNNIKLLKKQLGETKFESEDYAKVLGELKLNQNALKDAMYATSASFEQVIESASGTSESYNSLVHRMAALKEEWRATNEEARRNEVGRQIAEVNQQLKDMDASIGNFQRNVGNYESGVAPLVKRFDELGGILKQMPPTLGAAKESIGKVGESMQLVGKQPILGIIGLLAPLIIKITNALKDNETAMAAIKKLMESLQPVFDLLQSVLEGIAKGVANAVEWFVKLIGASNGIKNIVSGVVGVGNAILQYLLAPVKAAVKAFVGLGNIMKDVFTGQFSKIKEDAKTAWEGIKDAYKDGFSFKSNFDEGKRVGADFLLGVKDNKKEAEEIGKEIGESVSKGVTEGLRLSDWEKALSIGEAKLQAKRDAQLAEDAEISESIDASLAETNAEIEAFFEEQARLQEESDKKAQESAKARIDTMYAVADATSGILSSIADMMESDEKNAEKNAKKVKALRIASATIDMLQGAVGAFTQASATYPPPYGQIIGGVSAAAVVAMGVANIAKIKSTNPGSGSASASATPAAVSAPTIDTSLQSVRNVTTASEEDRLNRMASSQKVYILQSDIEAANNQSKAQVAETSF